MRFIKVLITIGAFKIWVWGTATAFNLMYGHSVLILIPIWFAWGITRDFLKWLWGKTPLYKHQVADLRSEESAEFQMGTD